MKKIPIGIEKYLRVLQRLSNPALEAVEHSVNAQFGPGDPNQTIHAGHTQQNELKRDR